jgi:hypothetical protein
MPGLTALQIMQQAAVELGLPKPLAVTSNQEATGQQLLALLNTLGMDLVQAFPWQQLSFMGSFATKTGQPSYDLPENYSYYIDQTFWDMSNNWPLIGPMSAQDWQTVTAGIATITPREAFRIFQNKIELFPTPGSDSPTENMSYQYVSKNWVESGQTPGIYQPAIIQDTDVPVLDSNLLIKGLKVKMWSAKGLNTDTLTNDFVALFTMLTGKNKGAKVVSLSPRPRTNLIGIRNVPDGSWNVY